MDKAAELRNLHQLKASGALSDNEFEAQKNRILNESDSPPVTAPPPSRPSMYEQGGMPMPPPQSGSNGFGIAMIIGIVLVVLVVIAIIVMAVLYVWSASFLEQGESAPIATFWVEETSGGYWDVELIKVSKQEGLEGFSFFLKNQNGDTYVGGNGFGEVAMQYVNGELHGIDTNYGGSDSALQQRAEDVSNDDGSEYPVHFSDNDRDGTLSAGDQFRVYGQGNSANGPAEDGWKLDIQFDASGDIIGSAKLV